MANKSGVRSMEKIVADMKAAINDAKRSEVVKTLGQFSINLISKRTRLGYGVDAHLSPKKRLKPLSPNYVKQRSRTNLSTLTSPKKSNLTRTGQLLDSLRIIKQSQSSVVIGPTGNRSDSRSSNADIAQYNAERGRPFLFLSDLEYAQMFREYRRVFGDLLKKRQLLK